jgi:hypothetical protein
MSAGRIDISRTTFGAITDLATGQFACTPHYLYFYPETGGDTICLDHARQAFRCSSCEAFLVAGTKTKAEGREKRKPEGRKERGEQAFAHRNNSSAKEG